MIAEKTLFKSLLEINGVDTKLKIIHWAEKASKLFFILEE